MCQLPDHISEAELLALVEGCDGVLSAERRLAVRAAVAEDPALAALVREMRADASALTSMPRMNAPSAVRTGVLTALQRPVARPEVVREPEGGAIPISTVVVQHPTALRRWAEELPGRRLAIAAGLLLAVGLGVWVVTEAVHSPRVRALSLARNTPRVTPERIDLPPPDMLPPAPDERMAVAVEQTDPTDALVADDLGIAVPAAPALAQADVPPAAPAPMALTAADAIELARSGRLVIRVRARNEVTAQNDVKQLAVRTARELRWRPLEAWELSEVTLALRDADLKPMPMASDNRPVKVKTPKDPVKEKPAPVVNPIGTSADVADALKRQTDYRPLYTVEMDENERDLAAILTRLTRGTQGQVAEFVALEEPLPTLMPSTDPAAVLWWTRSPSGWTRKVCVPIVLETVR